MKSVQGMDLSPTICYPPIFFAGRKISWGRQFNPTSSGSDSALLYDILQEAKKEKDYLKIEGRLISAGNFAEAVAAPWGFSLQP